MSCSPSLPVSSVESRNHRLCGEPREREEEGKRRERKRRERKRRERKERGVGQVRRAVRGAYGGLPHHRAFRVLPPRPAGEHGRQVPLGTCIAGACCAVAACLTLHSSLLPPPSSLPSLLPSLLSFSLPLSSRISISPSISRQLYYGGSLSHLAETQRHSPAGSHRGNNT